MEKNEDIRAFLSSPNTLELNSDITEKQHSRTIRRKKKEKLPPYIPYKSIYEETDMDKLTERQRIMVMKFRSSTSILNPLFITANDIPILNQNTEISKNIASHNDISNSSLEIEKCPKKCEDEINDMINFLNWLKPRIPFNLERKTKNIMKDLMNIKHNKTDCKSVSEKIFKRIYGVIKLIDSK